MLNVHILVHSQWPLNSMWFSQHSVQLCTTIYKYFNIGHLACRNFMESWIEATVVQPSASISSLCFKWSVVFSSFSVIFSGHCEEALTLTISPPWTAHISVRMKRTDVCFVWTINTLYHMPGFFYSSHGTAPSAYPTTTSATTTAAPRVNRFMAYLRVCHTNA